MRDFGSTCAGIHCRYGLIVIFGFLMFGFECSLSEDETRTIIAFGDSTTAPRGKLKVYADQLETMRGVGNGRWQVINAGVGGNTTEAARRRFRLDVLDRKADMVIIQFGINDSAVDVWKRPAASTARVDLETYKKNLGYFCQALKKRGVQVVLMTPNPLCWTEKLRALYGKTPYDPQAEDGFNVVLKKYAGAVRDLASVEKVPLIDVYRKFESFAAKENHTLEDLLLDGMHPNERGHKLIATSLLSVIKGLVESDSLIESVSKETLWRNRDGNRVTWFHPRACMFPDKFGNPVALMTLQEIGGSDYFGPVHWSISRDLGKTWSPPEPLAAFGREPVLGRNDGLVAAVCDVTPQYHPATDTVIAMGHVVFYKGKYFASGEQLSRYPIYAIRHPDGTWSSRKILHWDDPRGAFIYSNNCGQRVVKPSGRIQMSFTFGPKSEHRMVAGVETSYDGTRLRVEKVGRPLKHPHGRGLLEPSIARFADKYWLTMRAEDGRGYVSVSEDGLNWEQKRAWAWENGKELEMSTTQQHWLTHSDGLFLVYTRKDKANVNVIRWRSPLYVAQVDPETKCLIQSSERVVLPLVGDGVNAADGVALMGNFNVTNVSANESWVTVGEGMPKSGYRGDVLLARIRWSRPNLLPLW